MKRLVVNADDLGADRARNRGILEAVAAGAVTSVSLLANGPALEHALELLGRPIARTVSAGLHLNLSEGRALCAGHRLLTGPDGRFPGKAAALALLSRTGDARLEREVGRELDAQMARLEEAGVEVLHLDGHQHVHVFPAAVRPAAAAARARGVPWIRIPLESPPRPGSGCPDRLRAEGARFRDAALAALDLVRGAPPPGITDAFRGIYLKNRLTLSTLEEALAEIEHGITELMVHPGRAQADFGSVSAFSAFSTADREQELEVLLDPGFRALVERLGLALTPFPRPEP